jgi:CheY-like chemotaxis protein
MKQIKVLLVEDDEITNFLSETILSALGITSVFATLNGMEGLTYLTRDCPDLILLDIAMPVMDGLEFLEEKQKTGACPTSKIAMLTSSIRKTDQDKASAFPEVIDYVEKPLSPEKVQKLLAKL